MSRPWHEDAFFYHVYPLGFCGAPERNDFRSPPVERLAKVRDWIPHLRSLGVTAVYFGPVFESESHGYDTVDFMRVDRRLGTLETLRQTIRRLHDAGIRVVLDGVFHHVGRSFFAFEDVRRKGRHSAFKEWIAGFEDSRRGPAGDPFVYDGWEGHLDLVKLNLRCPAVVEHILGAVEMWIRDLDIDGLRLDVAYALDRAFLRRLCTAARAAKPDFWLMGEMIHGDYSSLAGPGLLDSVTNYEGYKSLYSSFNDRNLFEMAHSLERQFGPDGLYGHLRLYNFSDNHDVDRVASQLREPRHLHSLYLILFTMPGIPSVYYGSEWGVEGRKGDGDDRPLRPALDLADAHRQPHPELADAIRRFADIRRASPALTAGRYRTLRIESQQFAFVREHETERVVVAVNAEDQARSLSLTIEKPGRRLVDLLDHRESIPINGTSVVLDVPPTSGRILRVET